MAHLFRSMVHPARQPPCNKATAAGAAAQQQQPHAVREAGSVDSNHQFNTGGSSGIRKTGCGAGAAAGPPCCFIITNVADAVGVYVLGMFLARTCAHARRPCCCRACCPRLGTQVWAALQLATRAPQWLCQGCIHCHMLDAGCQQFSTPCASICNQPENGGPSSSVAAVRPCNQSSL